MSAPLSHAFFSSRLHQRFALGEHAGVELELLEAERATASVPGHEAFSLIFGGPLPALPQAIYTLHSDAHGALELFLVPVARVGDAIHYQAVFN